MAVPSCKNDCECEQVSLHLHAEIENLKQQLLEREHHIVNMETDLLCEADKFPNGEYAALADQLLIWQDKYSRLLESHKRIQRVNQCLEDKLLLLVDKTESEKNVLNSEITRLTRKVTENECQINHLINDNERYKNDLNIAIQFLQCKPSHFVSQKYDNLPEELQSKVRSHIFSKQRRLSDTNGNVDSTDKKTIRVPFPTYPPTAIIYSLNDKDANSKLIDNAKPVQNISASVIAKVLEDNVKERLTYQQDINLSDKRAHFFTKSKQKLIASNSSENILPETDLTSTFDNISITETSDNGMKTTRSRPCSVRLQEGSKNILLDNTSSGPVLYKSRLENDPLVNFLDQNHTNIMISDEEII